MITFIGGGLTIRSAIFQAGAFFAFGGYPVIYLPRDWPKSHGNCSLQAVGWIGIILGLVIILSAMFRLGLLQSLGLRASVMKTNDFYSFSRNPQVLGCALYVFGFIILWPSIYALVWAAALMAIIHIMVLTEEEHLLDTFKQDYELYCNSVPRYLRYPKYPE